MHLHLANRYYNVNCKLQTVGDVNHKTHCISTRFVHHEMTLAQKICFAIRRRPKAGFITNAGAIPVRNEQKLDFVINSKAFHSKQ